MINCNIWELLFLSSLQALISPKPAKSVDLPPSIISGKSACQFYLLAYWASIVLGNLIPSSYYCQASLRRRLSVYVDDATGVGIFESPAITTLAKRRWWNGPNGWWTNDSDGKEIDTLPKTVMWTLNIEESTKTPENTHKSLIHILIEIVKIFWNALAHTGKKRRKKNIHASKSG